jgi:signal transduction histidine kinase
MITGLRWRLSLSYVLVTLVVAVAMSIVAAIAQTATGRDDSGTPGAIDVIAKTAARVPASTIDTDTAYAILVQPIMTALDTRFPGRTRAAGVLDADGRPVVADGCGRASDTETRMTQCRSAGLAALGPVLDGLPSGATGTRSGTVGGHGYVIAALSGTGKQPSTGSVVAVFDGPAPAATRPGTLTTFLAQWRLTAAPTWLPLLLAIVVIGTGTGLLLSRRLVRQLHTMAATVRTWSRGDLTTTAAVTGHDEIADLAADLNHMAEQLRTLLAARHEIVKAQERHHVRRELHDGVKQELFAATLHLAAATDTVDPSDHRTGDQLTSARRATERAQAELTAIMHNLTPPTLDDHDLHAALTALADDFRDRTTADLEIDLADPIALPPTVTEAIYRIAQEALTNVRRHANARTATLSLHIDTEAAILRITDDGRGLDRAPDGGGLAGIRARTAVLGGTADIESDPTGTRVTATIPLTEAGTGA